MRHFALRGLGISLLDLLVFCLKYEETDPRDAVFAVTALLADPSIVVSDYRQTLRQTYMNVALHVLAREHPLRLLTQCRQMNSKTREIIPSWVPDWREKTPFASPAQPGLATIRSPAYFALRSDNTRLQVRAKIVGTVSKIFHPPPSIYTTPLNAEAAASWKTLLLGEDDLFPPPHIWIWSILHQIEQFSHTVSVEADQELGVRALPRPAYDPESRAALEPLFCGLLNFIENEHGVEEAALLLGQAEARTSQDRLMLRTALREQDTRASRLLFHEMLEKCTSLRVSYIVDGSSDSSGGESGRELGRAWLALTHPTVKAGDEICVIAGNDHCFAVREQDDGYILLGPCFVVDVGQSISRLAAEMVRPERLWVDMVFV